MTERAKHSLRIYLGVLIYSFALVIGTADIATFGAEAHDHHGQPCKVQYSQERMGHALLAGSSQVPAVVVYRETPVARGRVLVSATPRRSYASRAPPALNQA